MPDPKEPPSYEELEAASTSLAAKNKALEAKLKRMAAPPVVRKPIIPRDPKARDRFVRTYDGR